MSKTIRSASATCGSSLLTSALAGLFLAACGGGGGSGTALLLESVSVSSNSSWQLNRPIFFVFNSDIDFSTVNFNTIHIGQANGAPALGEFTLSDSRTVKFQPRCPTLPDNSDAGLLPGGVAYTIQVPGSSSGGSTVRGTNGSQLQHTLTIPFTTVNSQDPALLFIDTAIGPPAPVIRTDPSVADASYIEIGDDPANRVYFQPRATPDPNLGADTPAGFTGGLNLYSDMSTHSALLIAINQAVDPAGDNVNPQTVTLEYQSASGAWIALAHTVVLEANCSGTGALLRVTPTGILPQNHVVRVNLTRDFKDIVGDSNLINLTVGAFLITTATDPGTTTPGAASDEVKEEFTVGGSAPGSLEDTTTVLTDPRATWGQNGILRAGFAFDGTGGPTNPPGNFNWKIGNDQPPSNTNHPTIILDTSFSIINNDNQTAQETVVNGRVDIHDLHVTASGTLVIQGPNPCTILVAGSALIEGEINLRGNNNLSVATLNTTNQPEPGASGKAGGGTGGTGNYLTSQSTPAGGPGFGAWNVAGGGGAGGESAYDPHWPNSSDQFRRPAGGGGGTFGHDFLRPKLIVTNYQNVNSCPDQQVIGYDAEQGFPGYPGAIGVLSGASPPQGGLPGARPFFDNDPTNDFWGTMLTASGQLIQGELTRPWAGEGGGAGGNAIVSNSFPTTPFDPAGDEKGAGGGGAGGSLTILSLGPITFGARGRIIASGGTGGGGENSFAGDITHIGGGSGGGSGGHIILQTASQIDIRNVVSNSNGGNPPGGMFALGGNGGAGKNNVGGSRPGGFPAVPTADALPPPNSYPSGSALCGVSGSTNTNNPGYPSGFTNSEDPDGPVEVVICAGGDGGPGLIQLHTPLLTDILIPGVATGENIYTLIKPPPVGSFLPTGVSTYTAINSPTTWDHMLPIFGRRSQAISKWISLGSASVSSDASSSTPSAVRFIFKGTNLATGVVQTTGSGSATQVAELPAILSGTIVASPGFPYIDRNDQRTVVFDGTTILDTDDIYLRNVLLMKRFLIRLTHGTATDFEVASATYDPATHALRLTVDASGIPLSTFPDNTTAVEVRPRFFRVLTDGDPNSLPDSSQIVVEFQATTPNSLGDPNEGVGFPSAWVTDMSQIDPNLNGNPDYKFFRFRISFDISANGNPLTFDTPIPSLDFIRVPFRF